MIAASAILSLALLCAVMFWAVFSAVLFIMRDRDRHPLMTVEMAVDLTHDAMDRVFVWCADLVAGPHEQISKRRLKRIMK
jgi:hypothetical protein